ncbi:DctP family TRAP transporter solute-binding subunit [Novibacillus thermophilus]|uniref:DctP family TRAP transporter solute-binding subunit n=1 Tax=Novibacillus thermophilus TaxID=1471761 RepID=UPI0011EA5C6F|nr:DctP family TRAP transporter solute-binding subunit [Novibacillus thermophilus]
MVIILRKVILTTCPIIILFVSVSCQYGTYPQDHEQLSADERIVIRFSHVVGEDTPKGQASRKFAELVESRTDGYVEVQVFPNSFLYRDGEEFDALLKGDVQMIAPSTSKVTKLVPEWQVIDLPFAFNSDQEVNEYLESPAGQVLWDKLKREGLYPLAFWNNGFKQMTNNRNPLIDLADFKNLRFRVMSSEVLEEQFSLLGAQAHVDAFDQVYPLLEKGEIDAQENTFSNIVNKNIHTQQEYMTISNHGYLGYLVLMNEKFWQNLSDEIQIVLLESMQEVTEWERGIAEEINRENRQTLEQCDCVNLHELTHEERVVWERALEPLYDSFTEQFGDKYIHYIPKFKKERSYN